MESSIQVKDECKEYMGELYVGVVLENQSYNGYKATWVGEGSMVFTSTTGNPEIKVHSKNENWMDECWNQFLRQSDTIN